MAALLAASAAQSQTAPPTAPAAAPAGAAATPPAKPDSTTVQGVVVSGTQSPMKSAIDRRSYSVEGDLQATTGSIADALKRVPSVEVDIEGNVKLRGDSSVTILIDGKPSSLMSGQSRADALQQISADQIERVEVLTNPGAEYSPEGTAGVINLVTKKSRKPGGGVAGSVRGNVGTDDRYNGGINWSYNSKDLTLTANAGLRQFSSTFTGDGDRTLTGVGGTFRRNDATEGGMRNLGGNLQFGGDYDVNARNRISGSLNVFASSGTFENTSRYENYDGLGALVGVTGRRGETESEGAFGSASLSWRREFTGDDHTLTLQLQRDRAKFENEGVYRLDVLTPAAPSTFEAVAGRFGSGNLDLKADYNRPMTADSRLKLGFEVQDRREDIDAIYAAGPTADSTVVDPTRSHRVILDQTIGSGYLTFERPFGDLTVLAGLRYETATNDISLLTTGLVASHDYDGVYPSLHLDYRLNETSRLKGSYSLRIRRPSLQELDPWRTYIDAFNYREGNPDLEPSETSSWEVSYEYRKGRNYYLATGFWRQTENGVTDIQVDLGGGVLLNTKANLAESRSGGLEFVANRALTSTLSLNLTGTALWNEIDASSLGFGSNRSGYAFSGRASVDWQITPNDLLQINAVANGKTLMPQGYTEPMYTMNLGYRRKIDDRWFLTVTANDVFDSMDYRMVTDSPTVNGTYVRRGSQRGLFVGLRYRFGVAKPGREAAFDYGAGGAPAGPPT